MEHLGEFVNLLRADGALTVQRFVHVASLAENRQQTDGGLLGVHQIETKNLSRAPFAGSSWGRSTTLALTGRARRRRIPSRHELTQ